MTLAGPTLRFNQDSLICLGGAAMAATLDDVPVPYGKRCRSRPARS